MNISFDGLFTLAASSASDLNNIEVGDHDPQQRGFNARNAEIALDGAVDPYFEGFANIVLKLDDNNETEIELEEAFMQTTNLPFGLQLKGGQFLTPLVASIQRTRIRGNSWIRHSSTGVCLAQMDCVE
jgi:hypothetical protein